MKHTFNDGEDEMIENIRMNKKEATNNIENDQNIADNDLEMIDR